MMKKIKIIIDILMFIIMTILMGYHITSNLIHEILGIALFILFGIHIFFNRKYYLTLFKGKYSFKRWWQAIINIGLIICMIGMMISSVIISSSVFSFLNLKTTMVGRELHMLSNSWGYILMALHLGNHLTPIYTKFFRKLKNSILEYIVWFLLLLFFIGGIYAFIDLGFYKDMFLLNSFKYYSYHLPVVVFYLENIMVVYFLSMVIYQINNLVKKRRNYNG